jgi:hypothetical protein
MTTQIEQPTQSWLAATVAAVRDVEVAPRPVTTGEMLRRFGAEEVLTGPHGSPLRTAQPQRLAPPTSQGRSHVARRSSFRRLRRERVLMVLATLTLGLTMTGLAYVTVLFL